MVRVFGFVVLAALIAACSGDDAASDDTDRPTEPTQFELTDAQRAAALDIINADADVQAIAGAVESPTRIGSWNAAGGLRGAIAEFPVSGAPKDITAEVRTFECKDERTRGGIYELTAEGLSSVMVYVDLSRREVVSLQPAPLQGARSWSVERLGDAYFPRYECGTYRD